MGIVKFKLTWCHLYFQPKQEYDTNKAAENDSDNHSFLLRDQYGVLGAKPLTSEFGYPNSVFGKT